MKTSKKDYELFKKECRKWRDILGLMNWEICWVHDKIDETSRAEIVADPTSRIAVITLNTEWSTDIVTDNLIKRTAFHEIMELLLAQLGLFGNYYISEGLVEEEIHKIIRTLENVLFLKY